MEPWLSIWKAVLVISVCAFAVLSVVIIIGGAFDVRSLFRSLSAQHEDRESGREGHGGSGDSAPPVP